MCHLDHHRRFPSKIIGWKDWIQKTLDQQRLPRTRPKPKPNYQERGDRGWTWIHPGDQERYLVWSRGHQALNKTRETRGWIEIHPKLRVDAYKNWRRRSNKNGETRRWARVHQGGGARHWLQSTRIVTCSCERSRNLRVEELVKRSKVILIEKHFKPTYNRITSTTHSATIRKRWSVKWAM